MCKPCRECFYLRANKDSAFGYSFDALNPAGTPNELSEAMQSALKVPKGLPIFAILQAIFPPLRIIVGVSS